MPTSEGAGASQGNLNPEATKKDEEVKLKSLDLAVLDGKQNPTSANQIDLNAKKNSKRNEKGEPLTSVVSKSGSSSSTTGGKHKISLSKVSKEHLKERLLQVNREKRCRRRKSRK